MVAVCFVRMRCRGQYGEATCAVGPSYSLSMIESILKWILFKYEETGIPPLAREARIIGNARVPILPASS